MKHKKIELILFLFGLYMVFYGLIKRVILDFGVDIVYTINYFFYPMFVVTFGLMIIIKSRKMNVTMSIFCLFYGLFFLLLIISDNFWASLLSFFTTYWVFTDPRKFMNCISNTFRDVFFQNNRIVKLVFVGVEILI